MVKLLEFVDQIQSLLQPDRPLARRSRQKRARAASGARSSLAVESLEGRLLMDAAAGCCGMEAMAHADHSVLQAEHHAVLDLVPETSVTHQAVQDGRWSDPQTWAEGRLPEADARVLIPEGLTVVLDLVSTTTLATVRVDGTFQFDSTRDTGLRVDTLVISETGTLEIGTADNPIPAGVEARITIADRGPIDTHWDPRLLSRGLISQGTVRMYGVETTSFAALTGPVWKGDTELVLAEVPTGWEVGDRLILTGASALQNQDEELTILAISDNRVSVRPLLFNHAPPVEGLSVHVANVSRNVVVESQNVQDIGRRGHVMFMHSPKVDLHYAGFYGLGRTDKRTPANDAEVDADGQLVPGTGLNQRARYPVHFHRTGVCPEVAPAVVVGSAVVDGPGWGYVNHSSNVIMEDNVSFNVAGAGFVTETGDEIGTMRRNIAIRSEGSSDTLESRDRIQDFGHQGYGFWFQGSGVKVSDNVAAGHRHSGFLYFTRGLKHGEMGTTTYLAANLEDPRWAKGAATIDVGSVPIREFQNNTAYASGSGFQTFSHMLNAQHSGRSIIDDLTVWNTRGTGVFIPSTGQITLRNLHLFGNLDEPGAPGSATVSGTGGISSFIPYNNPPIGTGIGGDDQTRDVIYENLNVQGWATGIAVPERGSTIIRGGKFNNLASIVIPTAMDRGRRVTITGDIQFGTLSTTSLGNVPGGIKQSDILLRANFSPRELDITRLFERDVIRLNTPAYPGRQLYYREQAADFVPFPADRSASYLPPELLGKTNQQLWEEYGLAIGGVVAPADAVADPRITGLIGAPAAYAPEVKLLSRKYTNRLEGYQLVYRAARGGLVVDPTPVNLREGWNLLTRPVNGRSRTFLVFGDVTPPTFQLDFALEDMMAINPRDLKKGFRVTGIVGDNSTGATFFQRDFANLDKVPLQTRADGSQFVTLKFRLKDRAGNATVVRLELNVSANAPLQSELTRKNLPPRPVPETLRASRRL